MHGSHTHAHGHHDHDHHHGHSHAPADYGRAFAIGIVLNFGFVLVEATYGVLSGSMALVADAGHNLSDVLGLLMAWGATILSGRSPSARFTYGFKSSSILAALFNAALLLVAIGAIAVEAIQRLLTPEPINGHIVIIVSAIGIVINTATAIMFMSGRKDDLNIRGAFLHMAADALVSAGVLVSGLLIGWTGLLWIDPATSLAIVAVIAVGTWGLLKDSVKMSLLGVPPNVDHNQVAVYLRGQPGVEDVHDLHIWSIGTTETALTAHLLMPGGHPGNAFLAGLTDDLEHQFRIDHVTIQIELDDGKACDPCQ
ncbi:MAG: cation transporter [Sphingobium sp.]|nr:cation transporter [Sphingobium sp.]